MHREVSSHQINCPSCEFEHGNTGNPRLRGDGSYICDTCNSVWRELGNSEEYIKPAITSTVPQIPDPQNQDKTPPAFSHPAFEHRSKVAKRSAFSLTNWTSVLMVFCMLLLMSAALLNQYSGNQVVDDNKKQLTLSDIRVENIDNNNTAIWIISASIFNRSNNPLTIPPIIMKSGTKGSSGYFDWTYKPALQKIAPGTKLTIRTAIRKPVGDHKNLRLEFVSDHTQSG